MKDLKFFRGLAIATPISIMIWAAIILLIVLIARFSHAAEIELSVSQDSYPDEHVDAGQTATLKLISRKNGLYLYGSGGKTSIQWGGQGLQNIDLLSIGVGIQKKNFLIKYLSIYIQAGGYFPQCSNLGSSREAMTYYATERLQGFEHQMDVAKHDPFHWKNREFSMRDGFGGKAGANMLIPIFDRAMLGLGASYQMLELSQNVKISDPDYVKYYGGWLEMREGRNLSCLSVEAVFKYEW